MASKSSIHIQPVLGGSETHNQRLRSYSYVRQDLSHLNESIVLEGIAERRKKIEQTYLKTVGQKMQKKATPIREGVFLVHEKHTMDDAMKMARALEDRFGIRAFQLYIHRDEGHFHRKTKEWKPNLHAHILFDWTDPKTGKSIKLSRDDMREMQTIIADKLGMQRGKSSEKKHIHSAQFRLQELEKDLREAEAEKHAMESQKNRAEEYVNKAEKKIRDLNLQMETMRLDFEQQRQRSAKEVQEKEKELQFYQEQVNRILESADQANDVKKVLITGSDGRIDMGRTAEKIKNILFKNVQLEKLAERKKELEAALIRIVRTKKISNEDQVLVNKIRGASQSL